MKKWTPEEVRKRIEEAAKTEKHLPAVKPQGHFNTWGKIQKLKDGIPLSKGATIDKSLDSEKYTEAMKWMAWLKKARGDKYHDAVWKYVTGTPTYLLARRLHVSRTTVNNWRNDSYEAIAEHLNAAQ